MKKWMSLFLVAVLTLSLSACSSSSNDGGTTTSTDDGTTAATDVNEGATNEAAEQNTAEEGLNIAFFIFENSNTFTTYIRKGLESYGAEHNVTVETFDGKSDQATQTDSITAALAKGTYDIIVVNPVDSGAGTTINQLCKDAGVPVIYCDRAPDLVGGVLDEYEQAYYVGLDWSDPGVVQANMLHDDWLADAARFDRNGDGVLQYVILQGNIAQQNAIYRTNAIHELMDAWNADGSMPNEELDIQDGNWDAAKGKDVMDTWNVKYGDQIEVVLCNNDTMAMGAIESLKTAGNFDKENPTEVYGINAIPDVWDLVEEGTMEGTVMTSPYKEAVAIIDMSLNIKAGKDPLAGTDLSWGEFGKDIRISDVAIRLDNLSDAMDDYNKCR